MGAKELIDEQYLLRLGYINLLLSGPALLHVVLEINSKPSVVLLDTGASLSLCSKHLASSLPSLPCPRIKLSGLTGSQSTNHLVSISIGIDNSQFIHNVYPVHGLQASVLLGNDFFLQNPCYISYPAKTIRFGNTDYPLFFNDHDARTHLALHPIFNIHHTPDVAKPPDQFDNSYNTKPIPVRVSSDITTKLYGYEKIPVTVDLRHCHDLDSFHVFEWNPKFLNQHATVGPGLLLIPTELSFIVLSSLGAPQKIRKNTCIGYLTPVNEIHQVLHTTHSDNPQPTRNHIMTDAQLDSIKIADDLDESQRADLRALIRQYADVFTFDDENLSDLGCLNSYEGNDTGVRLQVKSLTPIYQRPYPLSVPERQILQKMIERFEIGGLIKRQHCNFSSPTLLVKKPDLTRRLVCDYRKLNELVLDEMQTILPRIEDLWSILCNFKYLSKTDFAHGFFQLRLDDRDQKFTGTCYPEGNFVWLRLPQGISQSPAIFQNVIRRIFYDLLYKFAFAYLDDVCLYSKSFPDHLLHLRTYFNRLRTYNLTLSPRKSEFAVGESEILGYLVTRDGIKTSPSKVQAIVDMPAPSDLTQTRSFLGMVSFYRRFLDKFTHKARPIFDLTKKSNQPFVWTKEANAAFLELKQALMNSPILKPYNPDYLNILHSDSSAYGIGGVLHQKPPQGGLMTVVCYVSRGLTPAEKNYTISERECLSIIFCVKKLRVYLYAKALTIVTDHHSLCSLLKMKTSRNARLNRWALALASYKLEVRYIRGDLHGAADCLSRLIPLPESRSDRPKPPPHTEIINLVFPNDHRNNMIKAQATDTLISSIKTRLQAGDTSLKFRYTIIDSLIYKIDSTTGQCRLLVPTSLIPEILYQFHDHVSAGHVGRDKLYQQIRRKFAWPQMEKDISDYVATCTICKSVKSRNVYPPGVMRAHMIVSEPFQRIYFDIVGPIPKSSVLNHQYIYVCIDSLTRYCEARSYRSYTAKNVALFILDNIVWRHGVPTEIVFDNASAHTAKLTLEFLKRLEIVPIFTTTYTSAGASIVERVNRSLQTILASYVYDINKDWTYYLQSSVFALNNSIHSSLGFSSFYLLHGRNPRVPMDLGITIQGLPSNYLEQLQRAREIVKHSLLRSQIKNRKYYSRTHTHIDFRVGDFVMVKKRPDEYLPGTSSKLSGVFKGPFRITAKLSDQTVKICTLNLPYREDKVHIQKLRPIMPRPARLTRSNLAQSAPVSSVAPAALASSSKDDQRSDVPAIRAAVDHPSPTTLTPIFPDTTMVHTPDFRRSTRIRKPVVTFDLYSI